MLVDLTTVAVVVAAATMALTPPPIFVLLVVKDGEKSPGTFWAMVGDVETVTGCFENSFVAVSTRGFMYRVRYAAGRHL